MTVSLITYITRILAVALMSFSLITSAFAQINFEKTTLKIQRQNQSAVEFEVEIARTPQERATGLMFRKTIDDDAGMIFLWRGAGVRQFWMKDTFISLDILFFDDEGTLVHFEDHTEPDSTVLISSLMPVTYVLEIKAGQREARGLEIGDYLLSPPSWQK